MKTLFIGQNLIHLSSVDSTNSYAIDLLKSNKPPEGTLIYTFDQKKGRGQRGNEWLSQANMSMALSLILYPSFLRAESQFLLTKIVSLAVADLMTECFAKSAKTLDIRIKWPNDIYLNNKKIAGILIENSLKESFIQSSVVGVGINVNQENFSDDLKNATSLKIALNKEFDLKRLIEKLCEFVEARYLQLKTNKHDIINEDYLNCLYLLNEWHVFKTHEKKINCKIIGVSAIGKLLIENEEGKVNEFDLKEIVF